jgi:hypothetical protein
MKLCNQIVALAKTALLRFLTKVTLVTNFLEPQTPTPKPQTLKRKP